MTKKKIEPRSVEFIPLDNFGEPIQDVDDRVRHWNVHKLIRLRLLNDKRFGTGDAIEIAEKAERIREAVVATEEDQDSIILSHGDWSILRDVATRPSEGFAPHFLRTIYPLLIAIKEAEDVSSEKKKVSDDKDENPFEE